jgi:uncharacterized protein (TIGR00369 family)
MKDFNDDNFCFVCGTDNPNGLKLSFHHDEDTGETISKAVFPRHFQGWQDVLHGGIISTVLDEIMVKAAAKEGLRCVTAELNVKFKKPALTETEYLIKGKIKERRKRIIIAEGSIISDDNKVIADAESKLFLV